MQNGKWEQRQSILKFRRKRNENETKQNSSLHGIFLASTVHIPLHCTLDFICVYVLIEKRIENFVSISQQKFLGTSITPKLHMIDNHMVDFLRKWRVGCELLGEQGAESIHMNSIVTTPTSGTV